MKQPRMLHGPAAPKNPQTDFTSLSRRSYGPGLVKILSPFSGTQPPTHPPTHPPAQPPTCARAGIYRRESVCCLLVLNLVSSTLPCIRRDFSVSHIFRIFNRYSQSSRTQQGAHACTSLQMLVSITTILMHSEHFCLLVVMHYCSDALVMHSEHFCL